MIELNQLVSIIIPVYNVEAYIEKCLDSILIQSYPYFEVILVDDGSTDNSLEICRRYAITDKRIKIFNQKNNGPSAARNKGIEASSGEFIQFIDSDDYLEPEAIKSMVEAIKESDMVIAPYYNIREDEGHHRKTRVDYQHHGLFTNDQLLTHFGEIVDANLFHYIWNKLYRAKYIKDILSFSQSIKIGEDMLFNLDYVKQVHKVTLINQPVYNHIWFNQESIKKKYHPDLFSMRKHIHERTLAFLNAYHAFDGFNKKVVEQLYARKILGCLYNVLRADKQLERKEKVRRIDEIVTDESVRQLIPVFYSGSMKWKVTGFLIKYKANKIIYYLSDINFKRR